MKFAGEQFGVRRAAQEPKSSVNHCNLCGDLPLMVSTCCIMWVLLSIEYQLTNSISVTYFIIMENKTKHGKQELRVSSIQQTKQSCTL